MTESSSPRVTFERVGLDELPQLKDILNRANDYAEEQSGNRQWRTMPHVYAQLEKNVADGDCYVIRNQDQQITAVIALSEQDVYMWDDQGDDGQALYVHKVMKDPEVAETGSGEKLLAFAAHEALRRSKPVLRCDVRGNMPKLIAYYERYGFIRQRSTAYKTTGEEAVLLEASPRAVIAAIG
jgi:ribosomal protein S18 acetylase RimI-like enzyme